LATKNEWDLSSKEGGRRELEKFQGGTRSKQREVGSLKLSRQVGAAGGGGGK